MHPELPPVPGSSGSDSSTVNNGNQAKPASASHPLNLISLETMMAETGLKTGFHPKMLNKNAKAKKKAVKGSKSTEESATEKAGKLAKSKSIPETWKEEEWKEVMMIQISS